MTLKMLFYAIICFHRWFHWDFFASFSEKIKPMWNKIMFIWTRSLFNAFRQFTVAYMSSCLSCVSARLSLSCAEDSYHSCSNSWRQWFKIVYRIFIRPNRNINDENFINGQKL